MDGLTSILRQLGLLGHWEKSILVVLPYYDTNYSSPVMGYLKSQSPCARPKDHQPQNASSYLSSGASILRTGTLGPSYVSQTFSPLTSDTGDTRPYARHDSEQPGDSGNLLYKAILANSTPLASNVATGWVKPRRKRDDEVGDLEKHAFKPMALAVLRMISILLESVV